MQCTTSIYQQISCTVSFDAAFNRAIDLFLHAMPILARWHPLWAIFSIDLCCVHDSWKTICIGACRVGTCIDHLVICQRVVGWLVDHITALLSSPQSCVLRSACTVSWTMIFSRYAKQSLH